MIQGSRNKITFDLGPLLKGRESLEKRPWTSQGSLREGEGSVRFTSLY
jgi:hypothetical protein